jgi:hypothetical protein
MKSSTLLVLFVGLILNFSGIAQSSLQFSQVINLTAGETYTAPAGSVFKVESINQNSGSIALP